MIWLPYLLQGINPPNLMVMGSKKHVNKRKEVSMMPGEFVSLRNYWGDRYITGMKTPNQKSQGVSPKSTE